MRSASANFLTYNALDQKRPVVAVEFADGMSIFVSGEFADYDSPPLGVTYYPVLIDCVVAVPEITLREARYSPATYTITLLDKDRAISALFAAQMPFGERCRILLGFAELEYADFLEITNDEARFDTLTIEQTRLQYVLTARDGIYRFTAREFVDPGARPIYMDNGESINAADTSVAIRRLESGVTFSIGSDSVGEQSELQGLLDTASVFPAIKIDNEVMTYTGVDDTGVPSFVVLTSLDRGQGNSVADSHTYVTGGTILTPVYLGIGFFCDPARILLHIMSNTEAGGNTPYDFAISSASAGMFHHFPLGEMLLGENLDVEKIERLGWLDVQNYEYGDSGIFYHFANSNGFNLNAWLTDNFNAPFGFFLHTNNGKLSASGLNVVDWVENFNAVGTLDASEILEVESIETTPREEASYYANRLFNQYNWGTQDFEEENVDMVLDALLFADWILTDTPYPIYAYGAKLDSSALVTRQSYINNLRFRLLGEVWFKIKVRCKLSAVLYEAGDHVYLTLDNLPDLAADVAGFTTARCLVLSQDVMFASGEVSYVLGVPEIPGYLKAQRGGSYYAINKVAEVDIDDTTLSVSAGETATTEAADAYYDNSATEYVGEVVMVRLRITPPAFGGGSDSELIAVKISLLDSGPAIQVFDYRKYLRFNPQSAEAFEVDLYVANDGSSYAAGTNIPDRVKVDWISTTASGSEEPDVELVAVWFISSVVLP